MEQNKQDRQKIRRKIFWMGGRKEPNKDAKQ